MSTTTSPRAGSQALAHAASSDGCAKNSIVFTGPPASARAGSPVPWRRKACRDGFSVCTGITSELFRELAVAHADGSLAGLLFRLAQIDVAVARRFCHGAPESSERRDFLESATTVISAAPDSDLADAGAHCTNRSAIHHRRQHPRPAAAQRLSPGTQGESMRKKLGRKPNRRRVNE